MQETRLTLVKGGLDNLGAVIEERPNGSYLTRYLDLDSQCVLPEYVATKTYREAQLRAESFILCKKIEGWAPYECTYEPIREKYFRESFKI